MFVAWDDLKPVLGQGEEGFAATGPKEYQAVQHNDAEVCSIRPSSLCKLTQPSFFGTLEGDFSLSIVSIAVSTKDIVSVAEPHRDGPKGILVPMSSKDEKSDNNTNGSNVARGWLSWPCSSLV